MKHFWAQNKREEEEEEAKHGPYSQCDQMEKLFFQFLAIHYNENMSNGRNNSQSRLKTWAKTLQNYQRLKKIDKNAKFGQVWSHWKLEISPFTELSKHICLKAEQ